MSILFLPRRRRRRRRRLAVASARVAHPPAAPSRRLGNCAASLDYLGPGRLSIRADGSDRQQPGSADDNLECAALCELSRHRSSGLVGCHQNDVMTLIQR